MIYKILTLTLVCLYGVIVQSIAFQEKNHEYTKRNRLDKRDNSVSGLSIRQDLSYLAKLLDQNRQSRVFSKLISAGKRSVPKESDMYDVNPNNEILSLNTIPHIQEERDIGYLENVKGLEFSSPQKRRLSVVAPLHTLANMLDMSRNQNRQNARNRLLNAGKRSADVLMNDYSDLNPVDFQIEKLSQDNLRALLTKKQSQLLQYLSLSSRKR